MRRRTKVFLLIIPFVLLLTAAAACNHYRLYFNVTPSLPRGIYRLLPEEKISRGDVVLIVDLDEIGINRALCPYKGLLKKAAALSGDIIDSDGSHIFINGRRLDYSDIFKFDKFGRPLPQQTYPYTVPPGCVYLASTHRYGYDSRYFGPISLSHAAGAAKMVFCFE